MTRNIVSAPAMTAPPEDIREPCHLAQWRKRRGNPVVDNE
jgi:hypothetical protein